MTSDVELSFRELVGQCIGEASMCWSEIPNGVFDSTRANKLVDRICDHLDIRLILESKINGHIEAMRPLLDEWARLK